VIATALIVLLIDDHGGPDAQFADVTMPSSTAPTTGGTVVRFAGLDRVELAQVPTNIGTGFSPLAILTADRRSVLYETSAPHQIRVHDIASGTEDIIASNAFAPVAAARSNRLAYAHARDPLPTGPSAVWRQASDIVVRDGVGGADEVWSDAPGRYLPVAWAGDTLLCRGEHRETSHPRRS
jgi:hypothetical protein